MEYFNRLRRFSSPGRALATYLGLISLLILTPPVHSDEGEKTATAKEPLEIHITSDSLLSDRNSNYAEFTGHVVATQKGSVLTSDRLKITYTGQEQSTEKNETDSPSNPVGAVSTIVATGNVIMTMEDKKAWAEKAVFNRDEDTVILTGGNPRVLSGKSMVSGKKIILNRSTGQISVDGSVNAVLYQDDSEKMKAAGKKQN
jgi:lipopolysaccharide export system protein LptA